MERFPKIVFYIHMYVHNMYIYNSFRVVYHNIRSSEKRQRHTHYVHMYERCGGEPVTKNSIDTFYQ